MIVSLSFVRGSNLLFSTWVDMSHRTEKNKKEKIVQNGDDRLEGLVGIPRALSLIDYLSDM